MDFVNKYQNLLLIMFWLCVNLFKINNFIFKKNTDDSRNKYKPMIKYFHKI